MNLSGIAGSLAGAASPVVWWAVGIGAAAAVGVIVVDRVEIAHLETSVATWKAAEGKVRKEHAESVARAADVAASQAADFRKRENTLNDKHRETIDEAEKRFANQRAADAAAAAAATGRLSGRIATLAAAARRAAESPPTAGSCAPAAEAADLLADVSRRLGAAGRELVDVTDAALSRGELCERLSDQTEQTLNNPAP